MRISGKSFDINVGNNLIHVDKATLSIADSRHTIKIKGIPGSCVVGEKAGVGELNINEMDLHLLISEIKRAGGFHAASPVNIVFFSGTGDEKLKVEAFNCLLNITSLLDINANSGVRQMTKIPFEVPSMDFVRINGIPYNEGAAA